MRARDLALLLPRLAGMLVRLLGDREVPAGAKVAIGAVAVYLASPVDLVPDVIPFVGYLDDLLLAAVVVDGLLTHLDRGLLLRHWPGSPQSLDAAATVARRLARWVPRRVTARVFGGRAA